MSKTVTISPLTRIEGHLAIHTEVKEVPVAKGKSELKITEAKCEGEMFRGFETILRGRDPLDAQQITQRICGVCPISHGLASVKAQEMAFGIKPNKNGRLLQNLILAANYLQSHIVHFYHLSALDFVDVTAVLKYKGSNPTMIATRDWVSEQLKSNKLFPAAPFLPRWEADYIKSPEVNNSLLESYIKGLEIRKLAHEMAAVFGAKLPHSTALIPGGCMQIPYYERILNYRSRLKKVETFVHDSFLPDVLAAVKAYPHLLNVGKGYGDLLAFGVLDMDDGSPETMFPQGVLINNKIEPFDIKAITEEVKYSWLEKSASDYPGEGDTIPAYGKSGAYTWLKAPRYKGLPMEVGPLARVMIGYHTPGCWIKAKLDAVFKEYKLKPENMYSVLGRHLCRLLECIWIAEQAHKWLEELDVGKAPAVDFDIPKYGEGYGLTEAPRGALGHWITIDNYLIKNYQCVVPTTWNCSPRDDKGIPGPVEKALEGITVKNAKQPMEAARLVRSYDPCLACAIH